MLRLCDVQVRLATLRFDANGDGCLDFGEFQQMLQTKPWVVLIPPPEVCELYYITLCHVVLCCITLCFAMSSYTMLYMLNDTILYILLYDLRLLCYSVSVAFFDVSPIAAYLSM